MGRLAGIRVLDTSRVLAGPFCSMVLGDLRADIIKVEPPAGDLTRSWGPPFRQGEGGYYLSLNRNNRASASNSGRRRGYASFDGSPGSPTWSWRTPLPPDEGNGG